jgi:hypothetical protein
MKKSNDDIKKLFKSFGADVNQFQELARAADASEAESRWPLLSSVQTGKRELPPLSWSAPEQHAQRAVKSPHPTAGLGKQLSGSLKQQFLSKQTKSSVTFAPAAQAQTEQTRSNRHAPLSKLSKAVVIERVVEKSKGLLSFAGAKEVGGSRKQQTTPDDALSGVFERIGKQDNDTSPATPVVRKGLLGRLGRP